MQSLPGEEPQYYGYGYAATNPAANGTFVASASGDLDGDNTPSVFTMAGALADGVVNLAPNIVEVNAEE